MTATHATRFVPLQPVVKVWLHSTSDASPPAALLLLQILPVFSVVAPCRRGASLVSVRRQTFTTGCYGIATTSGRDVVRGSTFSIFVTRRPPFPIDVTSTSTRPLAPVATWTGMTFCEQ